MTDIIDNRYNEASNNSPKWLIILFIVIGLIGIYFKINHWPFSTWIELFGFCSLSGYTIGNKWSKYSLITRFIGLIVITLLIVRYHQFINLIYYIVGFTILTTLFFYFINKKLQIK